MLNINNLYVDFLTQHGTVHALRDVSLSLEAGKTLGVVGESGSGKTQLALAIMGLLPDNARTQGQIIFENQDLITLPTKEINRLRGKHISMVFQDPLSALNPYLTIATQLTEVLVAHQGLSYKSAEQQALHMLDAVKIPEAKKRFRLYPHELSGGMRQRVLIAMALLCHPQLIIADEPTTALDVSVQAQIMQLLRELQQEFGMALLLITHDLAVVAGHCDTVAVLYAGQLMEYADVNSLFDAPRHPYTRGLLAAIPLLNDDKAILRTIPGSLPNLLLPIAGCPFSPRCQYAVDYCATTPISLRKVGTHQQSACLEPEEYQRERN